MTTTEISIIVSYVLFLSIFAFFAPIMQPDALSVTSTEIDEISGEVEAGIFEIVVNFINFIVFRLSILLTISSSNIVVGFVLGGYTVGAFVAIIKLIAEALP